MPSDPESPRPVPPESARSIRSFSGRPGRLTRAQARALTELWPRYGVPDAPRAIELDALFGRRAPRVLEVGFGAGDALVEMASARPDRDYLGVDVYRPGIGRVLLRLHEREAANVRVVCADAHDLLGERLAPGCLSEVLVWFPDPWPKKRHHKRRIVQSAFLDLARACLEPAGHLHLATDWLPYAEWMMATVSAHRGFRNLAGEGRFAPRPPDRPLTRFERRGERLGHEVRDLLFERTDGA